MNQTATKPGGHIVSVLILKTARPWSNAGLIIDEGIKVSRLKDSRKHEKNDRIQLDFGENIAIVL